MVDFAQLKNKSTLANLTKKLEEKAAAEQNSFNDDRAWQPTVDKAGNGSAVIRFLPPSPSDMEKDEDALPFVKYYEHNFQGPGGWYIEKCLTTLNQPDPCAEENNRLWNTKIEANQNIARERKRQTRYLTNILVVSDSGNPDNDGKVFLYRYGPKIKDKIDPAMKGDEDTPPFNPWDMDTGANFRLKIKSIKDTKTGKTFRNYDDSKFAPCSQVDPARQEEIWKSEYSLLDEIAPSKFKSYTDLKARLDIVLARPVVVAPTEVTYPMPVPASSPEFVKTAENEPVNPPWDEPSETDTTLSVFQKLAEEGL